MHRNKISGRHIHPADKARNPAHDPFALTKDAIMPRLSRVPADTGMGSARGEYTQVWTG